jgi:putative SOS response-associated peptidase YedK
MSNNFNLIVAQKQLVRLLVIQKLTQLQQHKNSSPKHKKPKHLHNKENCKIEIMFWNLKSLKVI